MSISDKRYVITMPDGSKWSIPINSISLNRAKYYAENDNIPFSEAIKDTEKEFEGGGVSGIASCRVSCRGRVCAVS